MNPHHLLKKAQTSSFYLFILNTFMGRLIPFNRPHNIKIGQITNNSITIELPYRKSNYNHIKGLHACGIATIAEYCTGLSLLRKLSADKYRIIMKQLNMQYFYQGKMKAFAHFEIDQDWLNINVLAPLKTTDKIDVQCEVKIFDKDKNHLATGSVIWQIKDWAKVKTK